jgi:hypothetical protein
VGCDAKCRVHFGVFDFDVHVHGHDGDYAHGRGVDGL